MTNITNKEGTLAWKVVRYLSEPFEVIKEYERMKLFLEKFYPEILREYFSMRDSDSSKLDSMLSNSDNS